MTGQRQPVVDVVNVTKTYRRGSETVTAVDNATLALEPGTITVLAGPSGSGKTTLLNLIIGWETPDSGTVTTRHGRDRWADLAVVPQRLGLLNHLTIEENVTLPERVQPTTVDMRTVMEALGLGPIGSRFPIETSLGEQQRAAVARAVTHEPRVLIADEPTSHQDEASAERIISLLAEATTAGSAVLISTHDQRVIAVSDTVIAIRDGSLLSSGVSPP